MSRDPELTDEEKARLLDPAFNDLIPDRPTIDPPELSPTYTELHPPEIPELAPDYVERPKKVRVQTGDLMSVLTDIAERGSCGAEEIPHGCEREQVEIASGLVAVHCPSGGLSMFRDGKQIYTTEDLTEEERKAMLEFREKCK